MAEQSASGGGFLKAFLPGLAIGLVVGGLAGAFLPPMLGSTPEVVSAPKGAKGAFVPPPLPEGAIDERAPRPAQPGVSEGEKKTTDEKTPPKDSAPETAPKNPAKEPAAPTADPNAPRTPPK